MLRWFLCKAGIHHPIMYESFCNVGGPVTHYKYYCARVGCRWTL